MQFRGRGTAFLVLLWSDCPPADAGALAALPDRVRSARVKGSPRPADEDAGELVTFRHLVAAAAIRPLRSQRPQTKVMRKGRCFNMLATDLQA